MVDLSRTEGSAESEASHQDYSAVDSFQVGRLMEVCPDIPILKLAKAEYAKLGYRNGFESAGRARISNNCKVCW